MQKSLVIVLALCLISVHAFVRRDVPATADNQNYLETLQKQVGEFGKQFNDKFKETFNPEDFTKSFNDALSSVNKALDDLKKKAEAPKA